MSTKLLFRTSFCLFQADLRPLASSNMHKSIFADVVGSIIVSTFHAECNWSEVGTLRQTAKVNFNISLEHINVKLFNVVDDSI